MTVGVSQEHEEARARVAGALRELERCLEAFVLALSHEAVLADAQGAGSTREALRLICDAYVAIDYTPEQQTNASRVCLGVIGGSASVIARAQAVNVAKGKLRDACKVIQNVRIRVPVKDGKGGRVVKSVPLVRMILRELQHSDLNLLAAYRRIPILTGRIGRVTYTRARTRAVYRKSRAAIAEMLAGLERPGVANDRLRLGQLPARETHLALVKDHYANVRANVWFHGLDARNRGRVQVSAELPLLYPLGRARQAPEIHYPSAAEETRPPKVRAGKLEDQPFLTTLPVHRYRAEHR